MKALFIIIFLQLIFTVNSCGYKKSHAEMQNQDSSAADKKTNQNSTTIGEKMSDQIVRSEEEWKKVLTPEQYHVLREKGTERPFTGEFDEFFEPGTYYCAACGKSLFESEAKYNSGCGWPAFTQAISNKKVKLQEDRSYGMIRTEVLCAKCGSHLGHVFNDGPAPLGTRYCINSISLTFKTKTAK